MALHALGKVTVPTPGTPVEATANQSDPSARYSAQSFMVEALYNNTGRVYIGLAGMDKSTFVGVLAVLPPPTTNSIPSFSSTITYAPGGFNMTDIFIDADVADEGVLVSIIRG